jgi:hypothetical protein
MVRSVLSPEPTAPQMRRTIKRNQLTRTHGSADEEDNQAQSTYPNPRLRR